MKSVQVRGNPREWRWGGGSRHSEARRTKRARRQGTKVKTRRRKHGDGSTRRKHEGDVKKFHGLIVFCRPCTIQLSSDHIHRDHNHHVPHMRWYPPRDLVMSETGQLVEAKMMEDSHTLFSRRPGSRFSLEDVDLMTIQSIRLLTWALHSASERPGTKTLFHTSK